MKLYSFGPAPNPRRIRMFLAEKSVPVEIEEIDLRKEAQLQPDFLAINPHATVPVLELEDGTRICSCAGIRAYIDAFRPEPALLGRNPVERGQIADQLSWIEGDFLLAISESYRNMAPIMKKRSIAGPEPFEQIPELAERGRRRTRLFMESIEEQIGDKPFLFGDQFTVLDIEMFVAIRFASWIKLELPEDSHHARAWLDRVHARESAKA